jgi:hypothetical protein
MTMIFGRDESLRQFEKSHGFFQTGEGSRRTLEDFFPRQKNRTKYTYDAFGNQISQSLPDPANGAQDSGSAKTTYS